MPNLSKTTKDHDEIRSWAEERGATPSHVKRTGSAEDVGILRFDFPGYSGEQSLEPISWEQFFEKFDERGLALVYEAETASGQRSNFNKLVSGTSAAAGARRSSGRSGARSSAGSGSRSRGGAKKAGSSAARRGTRTASKKSPAKKAAAAKRAATAKKSASRSGRRGTPSRAGARKGAKTSRTGTKKAAGKKTASRRTSSTGAQRKASAKRSRRR